MWRNRVKLMKPAALSSFRMAKNGHYLSVGVIRGYAGRGPCAPDEGPRCSPENMEKVTCDDPRQKSWFDPQCCRDACIDSIARFDDIYYKPNMRKRYTRTWVECPEKVYAMKRVCCFSDIKPPPHQRRPAQCQHGKACKLTEETARLMKCEVSENTKCPRITLPGCNQARYPPRCFVNRKNSACKKKCAPYPSYSECNRPDPRPRHPIECKCLEVGLMCMDDDGARPK